MWFLVAPCNKGGVDVDGTENTYFVDKIRCEKKKIHKKARRLIRSGTKRESEIFQPTLEKLRRQEENLVLSDIQK